MSKKKCLRGIASHARRHYDDQGYSLLSVQPTWILTLLVDYNLVHKGVSDDWGVD